MDPSWKPSSKAYPGAVGLAAISGPAVLLNIPLMIWHLKNRNIAAFSTIFWITIQNLQIFLNAIIWRNDQMDEWWHGEVYCDIGIRLYVAATVAIPGALACIMRSLANVMDTKRTVLIPSRAQRICGHLFDMVFCFGIPVYMMGVYFVVQPFRYYLQGIIGCIAPNSENWLAIVLIVIWPTVFSILDAYYAGLLIFRLYRYRRDFSRLLGISNTPRSRFFRLFILAFVLLIGTVPTQIWFLVYNCNGSFHAFSWSKVHGPNWNSIVVIPSYGVVFFDRWVWVAYGYISFLCFGIGSEASAQYRAWLRKCGVGRLFPSRDRSSSATFHSWPAFSEKARLLFKRKSGVTLITDSVGNSSIATSASSPRQTHGHHIPLSFLSSNTGYETAVLAAAEHQTQPGSLTTSHERLI